MEAHQYHHGDLRRAVLAAALELIAEDGPARLSMRALARRVGVSHAAPAHHFGDKTGVLTAVAAEGFDLLADAIARVDPPGDLVESGVAYVLFATRHRAHFDVMFRSDLQHADDPELRRAQERAERALGGSVAGVTAARRGADPALAAVTAWSFAHGFANLWLQGVLPGELGDSPEPAVRAAARLLFGAPGTDARSRSP